MSEMDDGRPKLNAAWRPSTPYNARHLTRPAGATQPPGQTGATMGDVSMPNKGVIRTYSPYLCAVQLVVIGAMLIYYGVYVRPDYMRALSSSLMGARPALDAPANGLGASQLSSSSSLPPAQTRARVYTDLNSSRQAKFVVDPIPGCDMRTHDKPFGVACQSHDVDQTAPTNRNCERMSSIPQPKPLETVIVKTTKSGLRFDTSRDVQMKRIECPPDGLKPIRVVEDPCYFKTRLRVNLADKRQEIIGFGGALTDSAINNILSLSVNGTKSLLEDYFGQDGLRYSFVRVTIGGSDFSARFYTNNDLPNDQKDISLEHFRLMEEDSLYKIPLIRHIQSEFGDSNVASARNIKLFASMWSPPTWMKTNGHFNKGQIKGSISPRINYTSQDEQYFEALINLKLKFLLSYADAGVHFWGMTVMNEPVFAVEEFINFNTMIFPKDDYAAYIAKYFGPRLKLNERLRHMKVMIHDDNRRFLMDFSDSVLSNQHARRYIDGVGVHGYIDEDYALMDKIHELHSRNDPSFFILPTELCSGHLPFMLKSLIGNWDRGAHYALDIIRSLQHRAAGWVDWNMALDTEGGPGWLDGRLDSPVVVDSARDAYYKSPMFYSLGHFSRYVPAKSVCVGSQLINGQYDYHLESVTFLLPDQRRLATVVLNNNPYPVSVYLQIVDDDSANSGRLRQSSGSGPPTILREFTCDAESVTTILYSKMID